MAHADWIIDFWPGAGHDGGRIVFDGTPADLVAARSTLTGEHLAAFVGSRPKAVPSRVGAQTRVAERARVSSPTGARARRPGARGL